jgi:DNA segregation ATPase FtsK/SpoIIIE, S-DNA-T family
MAKTIYRENTYKNHKDDQNSWLNRLLSQWMIDQRVQLIVGGFLLIFSFALFVAFSSYFFTGKADQSVVEAVLKSSIRRNEAENWLGLSGAVLAHIFIFKWFGLGAFAMVPLTFILGWRLAFKTEIFPIIEGIKTSAFVIFWTSLLLATLFSRGGDAGFWAGGIGYYIADFLIALFGTFFTIIIELFGLMAFLMYFFQVNPNTVSENNLFNTLAKEFKNVQDKFTEVKPNLNPKTTTNSSTLVSDAAAFVKGKTTSKGTRPNDDFSKDIELEIEEEFDFEEESNPKNLGKNPLNKTILPKDKNFVRPNPKLELEIDPSSSPLDNFALGSDLPLDDSRLKGVKGIQSKIDFDELGEIETDLPKKPAEKFHKELGLVENGETGLDDLVKELNSEDENSEANLNAVLGASDESGLYDPTAVLSRYMRPSTDLLDEQPVARRQVSNEELEANKDKIVETLSNYGIGISQIKATIGPTVTLYEIIPEAGVRISKIKNLEDDIALSLAALGIRIIAPIPGKGTIGIEVPNKKREMVSMRSVLEADAFKATEKALPIVMGKSITNEVVVADLAKMPHLLMAGATGQGKSVGLNVFLTSLIYKKHPAELKFVLIDPKKVELTLFNKIEKHFLAKLPGDDEAIITDTSKVIHTLNSLCLEMDTRYNLLKEAACRNLQEYNNKFRHRRLNPKKGHRFLPYIVLVIDELADLMMVAGKEVEQPIARLAQLARAIGIHLIVATQRPSVNVITGIIKANFPARLSFKVTSKIDSRTILDAGGAEQLVGMGDFLFSMGSDMIRLQCPFLDTPEVERICDYINEQPAFQSAYELPEIETEGGGGDFVEGDEFERDVLFEEAARIIVMHQQGSTSLLQRRLKLGYNRAGRLIDQLEKAGIVGSFEGSKAREVLVPDEYALERLLSSMEK